jgi:hypothetical protein
LATLPGNIGLNLSRLEDNIPENGHEMPKINPNLRYSNAKGGLIKEAD